MILEFEKQESYFDKKPLKTVVTIIMLQYIFPYQSYR